MVATPSPGSPVVLDPAGAPISELRQRPALSEPSWWPRISDPQRLARLLATGLLDSPPEPQFDGWTKLCAKLLRAPVALISLVDDRRQFFKSAVGLGEPLCSLRETPLSHSFCKHGVAANAALRVNDAREDPTFRDNPSIRELGVIAYLGVPLRESGAAIGMFCVIDNQPRCWTEDDVDVLSEIARGVEAQVELGRVNSQLRERGRTLDQVLTTLPAGVVVRDVEGRVLRSNPALERFLGYCTSDLQAIDPQTLTHPNDRGNDAETRAELMHSQTPAVVGIKRLQHKDGHWIWTRRSASAIRDEDGRVHGTVAVIEDITAEREAQGVLLEQMAALRYNKSLFEATISHIHDGVAVVDENWNVILANRADAEMFGFDPGQMVGMTRARFLAHLATLSDDPAHLLSRMQRPAEEGSADEFVFARPRRRVLRRTVTPLALPTGTGRLVVWHDITEHSDLIAERDREALTDSLTGIANRRAAEHALRRDQSRAERAQTKLSVALFDVDHFKSVNDRFGHNAGDDVLRRVAATLTAQVRLTDVVARWGGEEFIAVLPVPLEGARVFCERVRRAVEQLNFPGIGSVSVSAGVVEFRPGEGYSVAVGRADACLYQAKHDGRNRVGG